MIKSPSKHITLARLYQIRQDNYLGESGQEYCQFEIEAEIATKEQSQAMDLVSKAQASKKRLAQASAVNDLLAVKSSGPRFVLHDRIKPVLFPLGA